MPLLLFLLGTGAGSFLNCLTYRIYRGKSILGRSFCDNCGHVLHIRDLVPLFSYILFRGKCRYCLKRISFQHPLVEFMTGALFASFYIPVYSLTDIATLFYFLFIASLLIFVFVYSARHLVVPTKPSLLLIASSFLYRFFENYKDWSMLFEFLCCAGIAFLLLLFLSGRTGEASYAAFMGLFLGFPLIIPGLFLSFVFGVIITTVLFAVEGRRKIPLGAFLVTGTLAAHFAGKEIILFL